jgi:hypothetical protein
MEKALARAPGPPGSPAHAAASLLAVGEAYVEFAVKQPARFRVMFGPWCHGEAMEELPPETAPLGRDPYQILMDVLDGLVTSGAIGAAARVGAEVTAWSGVHGLASLLVDVALPLTPPMRAAATALLGRTLLAGLGCPPGLLAGPAPVVPTPDPRPGKGGGKAGKRRG